MDSIENIAHPQFRYVKVSAEILDDVEMLSFNGTEGKFKETLKQHFGCKLSDKEKEQVLLGILSQSAESESEAKTKVDRMSEEEKSALIGTGTSISTEIIPLTLPTKSSGFYSVNGYIDGVGRLKELPTNARATRLCGTDIRGDLFLSRTFDDEDTFKRVDFTTEDYETFLQNPPNAKGRWSQEATVSKLHAQLAGEGGTEALERKFAERDEARERLKKCGSCGKEAKFICQRCKKVAYCDKECQRLDWKHHKRTCG